MKLTIEMTDENDIRTFFERMYAPKNKPDITVYAAPSVPDPESEPEPQPEPEPIAMPEPVPAQDPKPAAIDFDDVTKAAIRLMDTGKQTELRGLLQKYGVQALPELKDKPDKLALFAKDLEVI